MPISIPTFLSCLFLLSSAHAQISAPNCTNADIFDSFNSLQQNPCWVMAYLASSCNNGIFSVPDLLRGNSYTGPSGADNNDTCKCNTVVYNLASACDACQGESWIPYSQWSFNCTTVATPGNFPNPVPDGTRVPKWAYIDTSIGDNWNMSAAQDVGDLPEVTGTASIVHPISTTSQSTLTPSASGSGPSPTSTSHSSSNYGAMEGGVIGGVAGATLISGVVVWFVRHRRARRAPSTTDATGGIEQPMPYPRIIETPRVYDPLDPTTYPRRELQPQRFGFISHLQPSKVEYHGLPEV